MSFDPQLLAILLQQKQRQKENSLIQERTELQRRQSAFDIVSGLDNYKDAEDFLIERGVPAGERRILKAKMEQKAKAKKDAQALNIANAPQEGRDQVVQGLRGLEQAQRAQGASPQEALQGLGQLDAQRRDALGAFQAELAQHSARLQLEADKKLAIEGSATDPDLALKLADKFEKRSTSWEEIARQARLAQAAWDQYKRGGGMSRDANPQSYAALNIILQKILDPTSVVRESEFARTVEFQSFLERIESQVEMFNEGIVTDTLMRNIYDMSNALARTAANGQISRMKSTAKRARKFGVDPEDVFAGIVNPQDILDILPPAGKALKQAEKDHAQFERDTADGGP